MGKKIAIIGTTASMMDAPYGDSSWEIWGLNGAYTCIPRYDRWFDMHDMEVLRKHHHPKYFDFLTQCGDKLTLNQKYEEYPEAGVFPYQMLIDKYGRYFSNTIAWLTALAIEEKPDVIGIWGVNMATETEYVFERPCVEYFLGIAKGLGIEIVIPQSSELLKASRLYGIESINPIMTKLPDKIREINADMNDTCNHIDSLKAHSNYVNGYASGINDLYNFAIDKINDSNIKEELREFVVEKNDGTKNDAIRCNTEVVNYLEHRSELRGALNMCKYLETNWR